MYEEICYKNNYIAEVVCRLDFASPINELNNSMPKEIYSVVKKYFPIAEPQDIIGTELSINPMMGSSVFNQITTKQWVFLSRDRKNKCTIEPNSVIFSLSHYDVFEEARKAFLDIISIVMKNNQENQGKRLGLRYINDIQLKDHDNWINEKFFSAISAHKDERTTKLITTLEYAIVDKDLNVRLVYGYNNPDYPAVMRREDFVIDIDAYSTGIIYVDDLAQLIDDMHFEVQHCFEKMITDNYRDANRRVKKIMM